MLKLHNVAALVANPPWGKSTTRQYQITYNTTLVSKKKERHEPGNQNLTSTILIIEPISSMMRLQTRTKNLEPHRVHTKPKAGTPKKKSF